VSSDKPGSVFKRLETDAEFIKRLPYCPSYYAQKLEGEFLDRVAWDVFKVQRKIIEAES
jgi:hypothetical protein